MNNRAAQTDRFLAKTRWASARRAALAGDASQRRYQRLFLPDSGKTAVLMDAPPELGEDVRPFARIARYLGRAGLSAPEILAEDAAQGFLLLEDFGDGVFAAKIRDDPGCEAMLYAAAVDVLAALHHIAPPEDVVTFDAGLMAEQAGLVYDHYAERADGKETLCALFDTVLQQHVVGPQVLILRDFHAENLIWLPDRDSIARVGLLDFQDAMAGPVGYDLVSLVQDARRDVSPDLADALVARFVAAVGLDASAFDAARAALEAQRNLRILGVFARLSRQGGKTGYIDLIPRVWAQLMAALEHPTLSKLAEIARADLPPPTADHLAKLRARCAAPRP